ncbi:MULTISPECIES: DUF4227 family protein [Paenibacillus]|uniref:DUF4227 family protein n=1 Tax=Paenibacillus TaxID=44249 RepID=UPI00020D686C|nr:MULTISPECIES: DUF4227 family protein [Paenibacillus]EGL17218.1 hypothetical protein HMPREF9413_5522 [Paenibacillus sp. HGF7]EPD80706.1 hypothetical protein HMPREF1207_04462 [Paenibacillus sp. HGH0039]MBV6714571.1 YqzK family protein [Paenibacillus chitinolyticus]
MIVSVHKWLERTKFLVLFVTLTYVLYRAFALFSVWVEPVDKYRHPSGTSVKVFQQHAIQTEGSESMAARLRLFYWYGE